MLTKRIPRKLVARKRRFHPCLKNAFAIAFAHVKRIHCVYDFPPRIPIEFLHLVRPRKRFILHSAILKISHSSPCLRLAFATGHCGSVFANGGWIEIFEYCIGNRPDFVDNDDLSHSNDKFCFFCLEREEISYNYL